MQKYKHLVLSSFVLKLIAMAAVLSDHIAYGFLDSSSLTYSLMRILGRLAFVLFGFFVSEGVSYSRNKDAYLLRLFALYVVLQIMITGAYLYDKSLSFSNIFATLFATAALLVYFEKREWKKVYYLLPIVALIVINALFVSQNVGYLEIWTGDYLFYGIALILSFYLARKFALYLIAKYPQYDSEGNPLSEEEQSAHRQVILNATTSVSLLIITFIWYILSVFRMADLDINLQSYALITIPLLLLYNGKLGHNSKGFRIVYYLFFPVHVLILAIITLLI